MTTHRLASRRLTRRVATTLIALATTTGTMLLAITPAGAAIRPANKTAETSIRATGLMGYSFIGLGQVQNVYFPAST